MDVDLFDFALPKERIALRPANPRTSARMLAVTPDKFIDEHMTDLGSHLKPGDILVFNDTKVIPGRLKGFRGEAKIEVTLHKRQTGHRQAETVWQVFAKPARKCRLGDILNFGDLEAEVIAVGKDGERTLEFKVKGNEMMAALMEAGDMPLPPYIAAKRAVDEKDATDYQTMFAAEEGAVAAPTAGLHFTPELIDDLKLHGVQTANVTLHVGAGTFLPVKAEDTDDHKMHLEWGQVSADTAHKINDAKSMGGRVVCVGTTSLRLLESAASDDGRIRPFKGDTGIFITPGYKFKAVDLLITNFHLPKSTLFMLVSAFSGLETMQSAYRHAIDHQYRFYSYGDATLLFPRP